MDTTLLVSFLCLWLLLGLLRLLTPFQMRCLGSLLPFSPWTFSLLSILTPLEISSRLSSLYPVYTVKTSKLASPALTSPWGSRHPWYLLGTCLIACLKLDLISLHLPMTSFPLLFAISVKGNSVDLTSLAKTLGSH